MTPTEEPDNSGWQCPTCGNSTVDGSRWDSGDHRTCLCCGTRYKVPACEQAFPDVPLAVRYQTEKEPNMGEQSKASRPPTKRVTLVRAGECRDSLGRLSTRYRVVHTTNTLHPEVKTYLSALEAEALIRDGVVVEIKEK